MTRKRELVYLAVVGVVFFLILEIGFRIFGVPVFPCESCPLIGYRHTANRNYDVSRENDHPITGRYNSFGWRDKEWSIEKPVNTVRVAVIGDSFVEALEVESDKTFVSLAKIPNVEFMNFGYSGASQDKELLILRHEVAKFSPDIVMCLFFPLNDIKDIGQSCRPPKFWRTVYFFRRHSAVVNFVLAKLLPIIDHYNPPTFPPYLSLCTDNPNTDYVSKYAECKESITAMAQWCKDRDIEFVLVAINTDAYLPEKELQYKVHDSSFDGNYFEDDLKIFADSIEIDYLGLQRLFQRAGERLHWSHWNYRGHEVVAEAVTGIVLQVLSRKT